MTLRNIPLCLTVLLYLSSGMKAQPVQVSASPGVQSVQDTNLKNTATNPVPGLIVKGNLTCLGNVMVNSGREVRIDSAGQILMNKTQGVPSITFKSNSRLNISGNYTHHPGLIRTLQGYYLLDLNNGSSISAKYGIFQNIGGEKGIRISSGVTVDTAASFDNCSIIGGVSAIAGSSLLTFENNQHLILKGLYFSQGDATYNIRKENAEGKILVGGTSGDFTGEQHEYDPNDRVTWGGMELTQSIPLPSGWSGLSSYMIPFSDNVASMISGIQSEFELLESLNLVYYPSQGIYTLNDWERQSAYKIKMNEASTLNIHGFIEPNQTFTLVTGWNLMPVICNQPVNVTELFESSGNNFIVAKEVASDHIYWPEYGINTIGNLVSGKAYFVKVQAPSTVQFPGYVINPLPANVQAVESTQSSPWLLTGKSGSSHIFAILPVALKALQTGDVIGAFTPENRCAGFTVVSSLTAALPLAVFADDPGTIETEGFKYSEPVQFRVFRPSDQSTRLITALFDNRLPDQGTFVAEGLSAISFLNTEELDIDETRKAIPFINLYPNPAHENVNINFTGNFCRLMIYGSDGRLWFEKKITPGSPVQVDISGLISGVYRLELGGDDGSLVKKLIIQ